MMELEETWEESLMREEIECLEQEKAEMLSALEELAKLGNGDDYGNSIGNMIARAAIARVGSKPVKTALGLTQEHLMGIYRNEPGEWSEGEFLVRYEAWYEARKMLREKGKLKGM